MQSSLLALALANKFFQDPLVGVPPAISVSQSSDATTFRHHLTMKNIKNTIMHMCSHWSSQA